MATQPDPETTNVFTFITQVTDETGTDIPQEDLIEQHLAASREFPELLDPSDVQHLEPRLLPQQSEQAKSVVDGKVYWLSIE